MEELAYRRLVSAGYSPRTIIDVGAHEGTWSALAHGMFPGADLILVEPQPNKVARLKDFARSIPNARFENVLLSDRPGKTVTFYQAESASSIHRELSNLPMEPIQLVTTSLDDVVRNALEPFFIKLDVQGSELEVLEGGRQTLHRANLLQLEVALLPYNKGAPTLFEVISYLDSNGFVPFDVAGLIRPTGAELVQMDLLFVPKDSPLRPQGFSFSEYA